MVGIALFNVGSTTIPYMYIPTCLDMVRRVRTGIYSHATYRFYQVDFIWDFIAFLQAIAITRQISNRLTCNRAISSSIHRTSRKESQTVKGGYKEQTNKEPNKETNKGKEKIQATIRISPIEGAPVRVSSRHLTASHDSRSCYSRSCLIFRNCISWQRRAAP